MQQVAVRCQSINITWNLAWRAGTLYRPAQPIQVECHEQSVQSVV